MEHAVASPHVSREVERGCAKKRTIITFSIDNAPLSLALELFLSESHWLDAIGRRKRYLTPDERPEHRTGQAVLPSGAAKCEFSWSITEFSWATPGEAGSCPPRNARSQDHPVPVEYIHPDEPKYSSGAVLI
jgi:hypothetical protein